MQDGESPDGTMTLVGVESMTFEGPELQGPLFNVNGAPNRYGLDPFSELHLRAWKANPTGPFSDRNPDVSCDAMMAYGMQAEAFSTALRPDDGRTTARRAGGRAPDVAERQHGTRWVALRDAELRPRRGVP